MDEKLTFDTSPWNGSASQWETPAAYCAACLIDENSGPEKTKDKCHLPYKKPGSSAINKSALRTMASGRGLAAVRASAESKRKAANWIISKWQAAFGKPAPANIYKIAGKTRPGNKATFYKDRSGGLWFLGVYSNNFEDDEQEMFSWAAHEEYAKWLKDSGVKPPIIAMHQPQFDRLLHAVAYMGLEAGKFTPQEYSDHYMKLYAGTAIAQTQAVIPLNGFMLVVGKVLDSKRGIVEKLLARSNTWGMSHGFIPLEKNGNIFTKYRSFEFTVGPLVFAANKVTAISFVDKDTPTMDMKNLSEEDRALIEELLGGTDVEAASEQARTILQRALTSAKMLDEKQDMPMEEEEEKPEEDEEDEEDKEEKQLPAEYAKFRSQIYEDLKVDELATSFKQMGEQLAAAQQKIADLEAQIVALKQTEDEKIAASFTAPDWTLGFGSRPTKTDEKLLDELREKVPDKLDNVDDAKAGPLTTGFWNKLVIK